MSTCAIEGGAPLPYVLHELIGQGRWGCVHRATDCRSGRDVAVKVVDGSGQEELAHGFRVLAGLSHQGIVGVFDLHELPNGACMSMELVAGGSLARTCASWPPLRREAVLVGVLAELTDALDHLHASGWIHRDVKPENLLYDEDGARLADLGLAHPIAGAMTAPAGTPPYMAPEAFLRWEVSRATDWYALGVSLWELLTGSLPFDAESLQEDLLAKQMGRLPELLGVVDVPFWAPLLTGLLDPDPRARWDASAIRAHLERSELTRGAGESRGSPSDCRGGNG